MIVPTYARPEALVGCLQSMRQLTYPRQRFEVVVVDDGSPQPLDGLLERFADLNLRLLRRPNGGPGPARNSGAAAARGRVLAFTDDDCRPTPGWLTCLAEAQERYPEALLGGETVTPTGAGIYDFTAQAVQRMVYAFFNAEPERARFLASSNIALPAAVFARLGGFLEHWNSPASEDRELCDRFCQQGVPLVLVPEARVYHVPGLTFSRYCRMFFNYGRGAFCFNQLRRARGTGQFQNDLGFHAQLPVLAAPYLRELPPARRPACLALLGLWQAANLAGFVYEAARARRANR